MTTLTGYSDDLIELEGDLGEEIPFDRASDEGVSGHLAFSDGTLLRVVYDMGGIWRFSPVAKGALFDHIDVGSEEDDSFDVVYFKDGLKWCLFAETNQYNVVVSTAQK